MRLMTWRAPIYQSLPQRAQQILTRDVGLHVAAQVEVESKV